MTQYAQIAERTAGLWTPFGYDFAVKLFGADRVDALPRFKRGKHKDGIKAVLRWRRVERGGWVKDGPSGYNGYHGHVENRVGRIIEAEIRECAWPEPYGKVIHSLEVVERLRDQEVRTRALAETHEKFPVVTAENFAEANDYRERRIDELRQEIC